MQQMTVRSGGSVQAVFPEGSIRTHRRRPLDVTFARRLHAYKDELAEHKSRAAAEEEDLRFRQARMARLQAAVQRDRIVPVFQPIVDLRTGGISGCEALSRFHLEPFRPPDQWFAEAEEQPGLEPCSRSTRFARLSRATVARPPVRTSQSTRRRRHC